MNGEILTSADSILYPLDVETMHFVTGWQSHPEALFNSD